MGIRICVIGVDPGPIPGIVKLAYEEFRGELYLGDVELAQCSPSLAAGLVHTLGTAPGRGHYNRKLIAIERFVVGRRAARSSTAAAGATTRDLVGALTSIYPQAILRSASEVKPWATDERLAAGGIEIPSGMRHAKDAARHALFAAVKDGRVPDPLSRSQR